MKKIIAICLFLAAFVFSCGESKPTESADSQAIEEAQTLDSLSIGLEQTIQEIDKSEAELKAALEDLDD